MIRTPLLALALLLQLPAGPTDDPSFAHLQRSVDVPSPGQACVVLDAATLEHAAPSLTDLRLHDASSREIPYVLTLSEAEGADSEPARVLNLGLRGRALSFDLEMPARHYTDVVLDLAGHNFLATAVVTGIPSPGAQNGTSLGSFNLFDLSGQRLSRSTTLHLQESSFPFLHIALTAAPAGNSTFKATPSMVRGASIPPSREAQTLFTTAVQTSTFEQQGKSTAAHLQLPERIPIERVAFTLLPAFHENFSRDVTLTTHTSASTGSDPGDLVNGTISRVRLAHPNTGDLAFTNSISEQQLTLPATLGANLQGPATVDITINNGDDPPLGLASVQLQMRQRSLCFQAPTAGQMLLTYGDPGLAAPVYDLSRTYTPAAHTTVARLGPEQLNPAWHQRPDTRPYTERHPHLLWIALLAVVCSLALVAFRSSHSHHGHR